MLPKQSFRFNCRELAPFDYKLLMYNEVQQIGPKEQELLDFFRRESLHIGGNYQSPSTDGSDHFLFKFKQLRKKMTQYGTQQYVVDVLVKGLYESNSKRKAALWYCYGDVLYENLADALEYEDGVCDKCGKRYHKGKTSRKYCFECEPIGAHIELHENQCEVCGGIFKTSTAVDKMICSACKMKIREEKRPDPYCLDCGTPIKRGTRGRTPVRCPVCQKRRNAQVVKEWKLMHKQMKK